MPPNMGSAIGDLSNDDYVAQVLAQEARDSSLKYSAQGMGAYMPKRWVILTNIFQPTTDGDCHRPAGAAPKPNTRFLRHIIKETDNHNAALKRKEEREARERMQQLRHKTAATRLAGESESRSHRHRDRDSRRDDRGDRHRSHRRRHRSRSASVERARHRKHRRRRDESDDSEEERYRSSKKSRRRRSYSRSRSRSPRDEDRHSRSHRRRHYKRADPSRSRSRSRSPETDDRRRHRRKEESSRLSPVPRASPTPPPAAPSENESDPLEDLVGPLPPKENAVQPLRSRGRGAYKLSASNIDAHFAADYDPTLDVQLEDDDTAAGSKPTRRPVAGLMTGDDDWELSLEALRDRAHWRRRGEDRLREAGFNDAFVEKWKANTTPAAATEPDAEGRLEDVRWSKKGEGREWDRGKFVDEDGHIDVKASW